MREYLMLLRGNNKTLKNEKVFKLFKLDEEKEQDDIEQEKELLKEHDLFTRDFSGDY